MELVRKLSGALLAADQVEIGPSELPEEVPTDDTFKPFQLVEDKNITTACVPKKEMVTAALVAQKTFRSAIDASPVSEAVLDLSNVLLLAAYEHHSATNIRHKLVEQGLQSEGAELRFLDLLLTSKLKKQSKSPTLWNYRRGFVKSASMDLFTPKELFKEVNYLEKINALLGEHYYDTTGLGPFLEHEFDVILRSAQVHKHNYYAWGYARWVTDLVVKENKELFKKLLSLMLLWVSKHPSDTSGWSFFTYLSLKLDEKDRRAVLDTLRVVQNDFVGSETFYVCLRTLLTSVSQEAAQEWLTQLDEGPEKEEEGKTLGAANTLQSLMKATKERDAYLKKQALNFFYRREPRVEV
ncbi:hypothetical protein B0I71DRAFT_151641 [Yarrowia lipolytica]|uniref:Uncharacterized protein n=1 Tax=Yarrowia lipolytica TaxID=4952 RepID=A0A371CAP4_YARLL|nr:hypothetical protein B0I71DRAFT_151641 [Yarrowia lipolytica]